VAKQPACQFCGATGKKNIQAHERVCGKNPNRIGGKPGRPKKEVPSATPGPSFVPEIDVMPHAELPDFSLPWPTEDATTQPPPPGTSDGAADSSKPPPTPPPPVEVAFGPMIDLVCTFFDEGVRGAIGTADTTEPTPPERITKDEREQLSKSIELAFNKYLPIIAKYAVEINLLVVTGAIFVPRLIQARAYNKWRAEEQKRAKIAAAPQRTSPAATVQMADGAAVADLGAALKRKYKEHAE